MPPEPKARQSIDAQLVAAGWVVQDAGRAGRYAPLDQQDTARWDAERIAEAEALLRRATLAGRPGRFQLEASIQSAHVARLRSGVANWPVIVGFYDLLMAVAPSVGAAVSRAAAVSQATGPRECLEELDRLAPEWGQRLASFQPYWAVRGDALRRAGRPAEAADAYQRAMGLSTCPAVRTHLAAQRSACDRPEASPIARPPRSTNKQKGLKVAAEGLEPPTRGL